MRNELINSVKTKVDSFTVASARSRVYAPAGKRMWVVRATFISSLHFSVTLKVLEAKDIPNSKLNKKQQAN